MTTRQPSEMQSYILAAFCLAVLALFLVAPSSADEQEQQQQLWNGWTYTPLVSTELAAVREMIAAEAVELAQIDYNYAADNCFNSGRNVSNATVIANANLIGKSFCPPGVFEWWNTTDGVGPTFTAQGVVQEYYFLATQVFYNFSLHDITSLKVIFQSPTVATLEAKLITWVRVWEAGQPAPLFVPAFGWYTNKWVFHNGAWCMAIFQSGTSNQGIVPWTETEYNQFPDLVGNTPSDVPANIRRNDGGVDEATMTKRRETIRQNLKTKTMRSELKKHKFAFV